MARFTVDLSGLEAVMDEVDAMRERAEKLDTPLRAAADELGEVILESFTTQQSPLGQAWAPLDPDGDGKQPLAGLQSAVRTGTDGRSITFGVQGPKAVAAGVAQFGAAKSGRGGKTRVPARPFMPLDPAGKPSFASGRAKTWMDRVRERVVEWILTGK
jgi:phage gpG-like protein